MHIACECGNFEMVHYLLHHEFDPNIQNIFGMRPIDCVVDSEIANLLFSAGANLPKIAPLHIFKNDNVELFRYFIEHRMKLHPHHLLYAVGHQAVQIVKYILSQSNTRINHKCKQIPIYGFQKRNQEITALMYARQIGNSEIITMLLQAGAK